MAEGTPELRNSRRFVHGRRNGRLRNEEPELSCSTAAASLPGRIDAHIAMHYLRVLWLGQTTTRVCAGQPPRLVRRFSQQGEVKGLLWISYSKSAVVSYLAFCADHHIT
jgi:hypothetical protein